jgi:hypothetical protein
MGWTFFDETKQTGGNASFVLRRWSVVCRASARARSGSGAEEKSAHAHGRSGDRETDDGRRTTEDGPHKSMRRSRDNTCHFSYVDIRFGFCVFSAWEVSMPSAKRGFSENRFQYAKSTLGFEHIATTILAPTSRLASFLLADANRDGLDDLLTLPKMPTAFLSTLQRYAA